MFSSAQASTSHPTALFAPSVTAIPWELLSAAATAEPDGVSAPTSQWGGAAATSVKTCSTDSTPAWAGEFSEVADTLAESGQRALASACTHTHTHTYARSRHSLCKGGVQIACHTT